MDLLDILLHIANLFTPALALGAIAAALAKLAWRREMARRPWWMLATATAATSALITLAGLAFFGRDGRMATYVAMVLGASATLWWLGFGRRR